MAYKRTFISFDWALKKMLRHKSNFGILEGFLSELLKEDIVVQTILESESNLDKEDLKFNRVDILVEDAQKRLIIIEVQYSSELDYFHRMLFATSKVNTEHLMSGYDYEKIRKAYSINLLYFDLGQGSDYIYHGTTNFRGLHLNDELKLSENQREKFLVDKVFEIYPEYYVIKINNFNDVARDTLDEWIYFLKNTEIPETFKAKGLKEAREKLRYEKLSDLDKKSFNKHQFNMNSDKNIFETAKIEGHKEGRKEGHKDGLKEGHLKGHQEGEQVGLEKGKRQNTLETVCKMKKLGLDFFTISSITGLTELEIQSIDCDSLT
jgi:predicted transposase/invertase (TIGR01784 family)